MEAMTLNLQSTLRHTLTSASMSAYRVEGLLLLLVWCASGAFSSRRMLPGGGVGKGINSFQVHAADRLIATQSIVSQIEARARGVDIGEPVQAKPYSIFSTTQPVNLPRRKMTAGSMDKGGEQGIIRAGTAKRLQANRQLLRGTDFSSRDLVAAVESSKQSAALSSMIGEAARGHRTVESATLAAANAWEQNVGQGQDIEAPRQPLGRLRL